MAVTETLKETI